MYCVASSTKRCSGAGIINWRNRTCNPLIDINGTTWEHLAPPATSVDYVVLVRINKSNRISIPPDLSFVCRAPTGAYVVYGTGVVTGWINSANEINVSAGNT